VPFNIASYALLLCMVASWCDMDRGDFIHVIGDAHVYENHVEALVEQVTRCPNPFPELVLESPQVVDFKLADVASSIDAYVDMFHVSLEGYASHPPLEMKLVT